MGFAAEIRRVDEIDMRLELDIDEWDERADATEDDGEVDRGVEMSEVVLLDAIACVRVERGKTWRGRRVRETRL